MKTIDDSPQRKAHATYCELVRPIFKQPDRPYDAGTRFRLEAFLLQYTHDDLQLVLKYLVSQVRRGIKTNKCLLLNSFLETANGVFADHLQAARAEVHNRRQAGDPARRSVMMATGRNPDPDRPERKAGEVVKDYDHMAELIRQMRKEAGI